MNEKAYFLHRGGERLYAFLHEPAIAPRGAVLLCTPLAEEKLWAQRVFVSFARELARRGFVVLRFDFRGEGDSDRRFEETSLRTRIEDVGCAIEELRRHAPIEVPVTLVGLRLGATIAALAARERQDVQQLALWEPVTDGREYVQSMLRSNLMQQMARHRRVVEDRESLTARMEAGELVNVEGYGLGGALYRETSEIRLVETPPPAHVRSLIASISAPGAPPREPLAALARGWEHSTLASVVEEPFWREIRAFYRRADRLFAATTDWLETA